jgi:hypothetical protein
VARFIGSYCVPTADAQMSCAQARRIQFLATKLDFRTEMIGKVSVAFDPNFASFFKYDSNFCLLSGQFIHRDSNNLEEDVQLLVATLQEPGADNKIDNFLRNCRGNFSAIFGGTGEDNCYLATDCLATRPVFVWEQGGGRFFSGQLSLAWELADISLSDWDEQGLLETVCFGIPLSTRTDHPGVSVIDAGTVTALNGQSLQTHPYRVWRKSPPLDLSMKDHAERLHDAFVSSVCVRRKRYGGDYCLLSGGMDSRAIAVTLRQKGDAPLFFNFGSVNIQDYKIAAELTQKWKTRLVSKSIDAVAFESLGGIENIVATIMNDEIGYPTHACRPVWTGDGGSLCLGAVYLDRETVELATRERQAAVANFVRQNHWTLLRAYRPVGLTEQFSAKIVESEIASYGEIDVLSALFVFLLKNDQRRHLWDYFEKIHLLRHEPVTPFFDQHFLSVVDSCPVDALLYHQMYSKFFECLPNEATVTGWQTYPGHTPCPIPIPEGAEKQWDQTPKKHDIAARHRDALNIIRAVFFAPWPSRIQGRLVALIFAFACLAGVRRLDYLVKKSGVLARLSIQRHAVARHQEIP